MSLLSFTNSGKSLLAGYIQKNGRAPQVSLVITALDGGGSHIKVTNFLSYSFSSSILIPVDQFQFQFTLPNSQVSVTDFVKEGDIAELYAGDTIICTGIIDSVTLETTIEDGDVVTVIGRNLLGQLEDQHSVNTDTNPMWGNNVPLTTAVGSVIQYTRIRGLGNQGAPAGNFVFATEPGESKLSALQRFCEPLNCVFWGSPNGYIIVGRPNMGQAPVGAIICDRVHRTSNVQGIKVVRASTQIPNIILSIWSGQETVQKSSKFYTVNNPADGPSRLLALGHKVQRTVITSTPQGNDPQSFSDSNAFKVYGGNVTQAYALREIAKANIGEISIQANVKSHFNDNLIPFLIDQVYSVSYPRGGVDEAMYLHTVDYSCDNKSGPKTSMHFCRLGCIVAGAKQQAVSAVLTNSQGLATL